MSSNQRPKVVLARPQSASAQQTSTTGTNQARQTSGRQAAQRQDAPRLKLLIRRLPPGLTEAELDEALGPDWKANGPKADWRLFKPGKISKDNSKISRTGRLYIRVKDASHIQQLAEKVRETTFVSAKTSATASSVPGPPSVEFAPYPRVPTNKARKDARQGTIDQDEHFIQFLASLTNPVTKPSATVSANEVNESASEPEVTPLIQYLRNKKANIAKDVAQSPGSNSSRAERSVKGAKASGRDATKADSQPKTIVSNTKAAANPAQASKENTKASRSAAKEQSKAPAKPSVAKQTPTKIIQAPPSTATTDTKGKKPDVPSPTVSAEPSKPAAPSTPRERQRGNMSAAARILQRDLGLGPEPTRRKREGNANPAAPTSTSTQVPATSSAVSATVPVVSPAIVTSTAPEAKLAQPTVTPAQRNTPKANSAPKAIANPSSTQAFLKHANASQGITEPLIEEALKIHGAIKKVEIDRKKGFAYVDFADVSGLRNAMAASPIPVAQGSVVVLERKAPSGGKQPAKNNPPAATSEQQSSTTAAAPESGKGTIGRNRGRGRGGAKARPAAEGATT